MKEKTITTSTGSYKITFDKAEPYPLEIQHKLENAFREIQKDIPNIKKLQALAEQYLYVPQFKNYLSTAYLVLGNKKMAYSINDELLANHPDYLFARLNKAREHLDNNQPEKVTELLGQALDISELFPGRYSFHADEVKAFGKVAFWYHLKCKDIDAAETQLNVLNNIFPDDPDIQDLTTNLMVTHMEENTKYFKQEEAKEQHVTYKQPRINETTQRPVFSHPEIDVLYSNGMRIDHDMIGNILSLPRQTLITDLENVINDSICRFYQFRDKDFDEERCSFVLHAVFLITELRNAESLPVILNMLRQSPDYFDYWFGDASRECIWECIYHLGENQLYTLSAFLKEPNYNVYANSILPSAVAQIVLHQPERRDEIISWFRELFLFFLANVTDDNITDSRLLGFMTGDVLDFRGKELIPEIEAVYNTSIISNTMNGDLDAVKDEIVSEPRDYFKKDLLSIYDRYFQILDSWTGYNNDDEEGKHGFYDLGSEYEIPETYVRLEPKIGRNDPCPCGSGKKYKKCCLKEE